MKNVNKVSGGIVWFSVLLALLFSSQALSGQKKPRILFLNSDNPEVFWWKTASDIMEAACNDLNMELHVIYVHRNRVAMKQEFKRIADSDRRPDAVVFQNLKMNAIDMLDIAETYKIPAFIFNAGLLEEQQELCGGPRDKYTYWIGQMVPDDVEAGYDLAMALFREARRLGLSDADGTVHFAGINGTKTDTAAIERMKGLHRAVRENEKIELHQMAYGQWDKKIGNVRFQGLIKRCPDIRVIWVANDPMAMGVLEGMKEAGIKAGQDMIVGSIDWHPEALEAVLQKQLVVTINGHFMETAWVSVLLYDYFHGKDFADESLNFKSGMESLTQENIEFYLKYFKPENFNRVDFSRFSKVKNPEIKQYDFRFDKVLERMHH